MVNTEAWTHERSVGLFWQASFTFNYFKLILFVIVQHLRTRRMTYSRMTYSKIHSSTQHVIFTPTFLIFTCYIGLYQL